MQFLLQIRIFEKSISQIDDRIFESLFLKSSLKVIAFKILLSFARTTAASCGTNNINLKKKNHPIYY